MRRLILKRSDTVITLSCDSFLHAKSRFFQNTAHLYEDLILLIVEQPHEKTNMFFNRSDTNQALQAQKMAGGWKFRI